MDIKGQGVPRDTTFQRETPRDTTFQGDQSTEGNQTRVVATIPFIPTAAAEGATGWSDLSASAEGATGYSDLSESAEGATPVLTRNIKFFNKTELSLTQQEELRQIEKFYEKAAQEDKVDVSYQSDLLKLYINKSDTIRAKDITKIQNSKILEKLSCETFFLKMTDKIFSITIGNSKSPNICNLPKVFNLPKSFLLYSCHPYEIDAKVPNCSYFNNINFISLDEAYKFIKSNFNLSFTSCSFTKAKCIVIAPDIELINNTGCHSSIFITKSLSIHGEINGTITYCSEVKELKLYGNSKFYRSSIAEQYFCTDTLTSFHLINITGAEQFCDIATKDYIRMKHSKMNNLHLSAETIGLISVTLETLTLNTLHVKKLLCENTDIKIIKGKEDGCIDEVIIRNDTDLRSLSNIRANILILQNCPNLEYASFYANIVKIIDCPKLQENNTDILTEANGGLTETFVDRVHLLSIYQAGKFGDDMIKIFSQGITKEASLESDENKTLVKCHDIFLLKNLEVRNLSHFRGQELINKRSELKKTNPIQELLEVIQINPKAFYDILPVDDTPIPEENIKCPILQMVPEDPIRHKAEGVSDSIYHIYSFEGFIKYAVIEGKHLDVFRNPINLKGIFRVNIPQNL